MKYDCYITFTQDTLEVDVENTLRIIRTGEIKKALDEGDASAQFLVGVLFYSKEEYDQAMRYFLLAADKNYAPAEHYLSYCFLKGTVEKEDEERSKLCMSLAVSHGDATAAFEMGTFYDKRISDNPIWTKNDKISTFWYLIGAKMGNKMSMFYLGYNYNSGIGVEKSDSFARYWLNKAAECGLGEANELRKKHPEKSMEENEILKFENEVFNHRTVTFGKYFCWVNQGTKVPIEWIVCAENDDCMMLISKKIIKEMNFTDIDSDYGWKNSKIRSFLNGDFIEEAFSEEEKAQLLPENSRICLSLKHEMNSKECSNDLVLIPDIFDLAFRLNVNEWGSIDMSTPKVRIATEGLRDCWWLRNNEEIEKTDSLCNQLGYDDLYPFVNKKSKLNYCGMSGVNCSYGVRPLIFVKKADKNIQSKPLKKLKKLLFLRIRKFNGKKVDYADIVGEK